MTAGRKFTFTDVINGLTGPSCVGCHQTITLAESAVRCSNCQEWLHLKKCSGLRRIVDRVDTYIGACCRLLLLQMDSGWDEWRCIGCGILITNRRRQVQCRQCKGRLHARRCSGLKLKADFTDYLGVCCRTEFTTPKDPKFSRVERINEVKVAHHLCELDWKEINPLLLPTPTYYGPRKRKTFQLCPRFNYRSFHKTDCPLGCGRQDYAGEASGRGKEGVSH